MRLNKSTGAVSFGIVLDIVQRVPHLHVLVGGWSLTVGRGWSYENVHEAEAQAGGATT